MGGLYREQDVGSLGLGVAENRVIWAGGEVQVVEDHRRQLVGE